VDLHQPGLAQNLQVLGHGLLGDVEVLGDLVDRVRPVADELEDRPPARLRDRLQRRFAHRAAQDIAFHLYK
jgi:hypothetical protein